MLKADYDFYRAVPSGGYGKGLAQSDRTDIGTGDISPEEPGVDFFPYGPGNARAGRPELARAANVVQQALATGRYGGGLWLEGSPTIEGTAYWLSLLVDTTLPIAANAAHRDRGAVSADGDGNILESIDFILSKVWADERGRNRLGSVMIQDEVIYSGREVQKGDAHPGGYIATGGYGGVLGSMTAGPFITNVPTRKHTWQSEVRMTVLPTIVDGLLRREGKFTRVPVTVKSADGQLVPAAVPKVIFVKGDHWYDDSGQPDPASDRGLEASIDLLQEDYPLAGIVAEGLAPYAILSASQERALLRRGLSWDTGREDCPRRRPWTGSAQSRQPLHRREQPHGDKSPAPADRRDHEARCSTARDRSRASNESGARCDQRADRRLSADLSNPLTPCDNRGEMDARIESGRW